MGWVSPTMLRLLAEEHTMLVYPVDDKIRFLSQDVTENTDTEVWQRKFTMVHGLKQGNTETQVEGIDANGSRLFGQRYKRTPYVFAGIRLSGSFKAEPLVYFRGAQDSLDHSIPLYFGGGFRINYGYQ